MSTVSILALLTSSVTFAYGAVPQGNANTDYEPPVKPICSEPPIITSDFLPITSTLGVTFITGESGYTPANSEPLLTITSAAGSVSGDSKTTSFYLTTTTDSETTLVSRKSTITLAPGTVYNPDIKVACCNNIKGALIYPHCESCLKIHSRRCVDRTDFGCSEQNVLI